MTDSFFGSITADEMKAMAKEMCDRLAKEGDPLSGDDWTSMQVARCLLWLMMDWLPGLEAESDLYRRGYASIGAADISNYLARCQEAGEAFSRRGEGNLLGEDFDANRLQDDHDYNK